MIRRRRRPALTLFEVILVMAVLVILAAISYPSMRAMQGYYRLHAAIDAVRAGFAQARGRAIEDNRPYRVSVEEQGGHFRIAPDNDDYWSGGSPPTSDPQGQGFVHEQALPPGVRFTVNGGASSAPPDDSSSAIENKTAASGNWTTAAVFMPNGTAREDVRILFEVRGVKPTTVYLRGLTGTVSVKSAQ